MKFKHDNRHKGNEDIIKAHLKTTSQDSKNPSKDSNIYVSKLMNQNKNKNIFINESLPNLKKNIQNIFANEESKEKAFQYLIKKNKDRSANVSQDYNKKTVNTPEMKPYNKIKESKEPTVISPYNTNNNSIKENIKTYDSTRSCIDIRPLPYKVNQNYMNNKMAYRASLGSQQYIYENDPLSQNNIYRGNNYYKNQNKTYTNLLTNNNVNFNNRNKSNKYEHIAIYNTYNNTFNNYKIPKDNYKNLDNQTYNNVQQYTFKNNLNNNIDSNPYKDYLKNTNLSDFKRKLLKNNNNIIDISVNENTNKGKDKKNNLSINMPNKDDEIQNLKMNYVKRAKNQRIKVQKNDNLTMCKPPTRKKNSITSIKSSNSYYVHKNLRYKKINQKRNTKGDINFNINKKLNNTIEYDDNKEKNMKMKTYEKRKNYYDIYGHKDIRVNTIDDKNNNEKNLVTNMGQSDEPTSTINSIKVNIEKKLIKDYYNSPLSQRYNKYFINNSNKNINSSNNINKKKYEKRDTLQRNLNPNFMTIQNDNNINEKVFDNDKNNINKDYDNKDNKDNNNSNKKKYIFNDEEEIIEFIKKKYNKRKVDDIIKRDDNAPNTNANTNINVNENEISKNEPKKLKGKTYLGLMTTEEGKKIKQKNEELSNQIKQLKYENKNYKKELNDMRNKFDDLTKEINDIKEKK